MTQQQYFWIFPNLLHAWFWKDLCRDLTAKTGLRPLFIMASEEDQKFWRSQFGEPLDAEEAILFDYLGYALDGGDPSESEITIADRAAAYEKRHGITFMRDMVLGDRHIGRGFVLGGQGHPMSPVSKVINQRIAVQTCLATADSFEALAQRFPPRLMLAGGGGGGVYMKPACLIASRLGIPFRSLVHARFGDRYLWADSEFEESETFRTFLEEQSQPNEAEVEYTREHLAPTGLSVVGFATFRKESRWISIIKKIVLLYLRYFYGKFRGYRKSRIGVTPTSNAGAIIRQRLDRRKLDKYATVRISELPDHMKVVYFPLQTEPEQSLNILSSEHSDQLATTLELALSLPANAVLAVKEHPYQIGRRTSHYYKTISEMPNVVFLNTDEPSIEIIKRADLVAVITGSAGYEAAGLGKPVLHFGRHGQALDLPHVYPMTGFSNMQNIAGILAGDSESKQSQRRRDGARYFLALEKFCLDMSDFNAHGRKERPSATELSQISESLLKTLPEQGTALGR